MLKNIYKTTLLALAGLVATANALEIRPHTEILFPAKDNIEWDNQGNKTNIKLDADLAFEVGSEVLFYTNYVRYGFGLAFKSPIKKSGFTAVPATIPIWLTAAFGMFNKQAVVQPYAVARFGSIAPLSGNGNWWEEPLNFMVNGGVGAIFPYGIGLEVVYDYASVEKSFKSINSKFRVSSGRIGIQLSYGFDLTSSSPSQDVNNTWNSETEDASNFNTNDSESYFNYTATPEETPSEATTEEQPSSADSPVSDDSAPSEAEPDTATPEPATEALPEEPAAEDTNAEEPAPEPSEPEVTAEPEPEAAPAPVEEPKPAAKKPAKKASKKAAKKSAKKSNKKANKKATKKKK